MAVQHAQSKAPLGRVKAVQNFGASDMLEVEPEGGGATWYLPFTREAAPVEAVAEEAAAEETAAAEEPATEAAAAASEGEEPAQG
jgi:16S rRNA processing protein RimM